MNAAWTHEGKTYYLLVDGQTRASIEPRNRTEFLLVLQMHGGRTIYKFGESVQKLMDHAEKELKATV